ncbi:MAG: hypothetical protein AB7O59_01360 [Pirellulales bacterium]
MPTRRDHHAARTCRRGTFLLEAAAAGVLLAVMCAMVVRAISLVAIERRAAEQRAIAWQEAAGAMEQAGALQWSELTPERLAQIKLSAQVDRILPGAELTWTLQPTTDSPSGKHVRAQIAWRASNDAPQAPVRLSYWMFAPDDAPSRGAP